MRVIPPVLAVLAVLAIAASEPAAAQVVLGKDANGRLLLTNLVSQGAGAVGAGRSSPAGWSGVRMAETAAVAILRHRAMPFREHVEKAAAAHRLSPRLIEAVIAVESNFNPVAVSRSGAQGLMQLMPATARLLGVEDPFDPGQNIHGGSAYLRRLLDEFDQDLTLALAAYNAGPGAVRRSGGVPFNAETPRYVYKVRRMLGHPLVSNVSPGLRSVPGARGPVVTNVGRTQSSLRLVRDARGQPVLTNR